MTAYRLFGAETSPYSLKVRSFLRYKGVDFEWIGRSKATDEVSRPNTTAPWIAVDPPMEATQVVERCGA